MYGSTGRCMPWCTFDKSFASKMRGTNVSGLGFTQTLTLSGSDSHINYAEPGL